MNTKNAVLVTFGLLTAASVFAKPMIPSPLVRNIPGFKTASESVDFSKLNTVLQLITNQTLVNENQVTFAYPEFDPQLSSIAKERLVYGAKARLEKTEWHSNVEITASGDLSVSRNPSHSGISMKFSITTATDLLAMVRYAASNALQKADGFLRSDARNAPLLERAANVTNMKELYQIVVDSNALAIDQINSEQNKSRALLECIWAMKCGNITADSWGNRNMDNYSATYEQLRIQQLARMRTSFESNSITFSEDKQEITILSASPQGFLARASRMDETEAKFSKVILSPKALMTEFGGFGVVELQYLDNMHRDFIKSANNLSSNDPKQVKDTQDSFREGLIEFKKAINAENIR